MMFRMFLPHAKRTTKDHCNPIEGPVGEVPVQMKGLSPAGLSSQAGTKNSRQPVLNSIESLD